ncbi:nucleolar protein dao-5-like [Mercenaria mercenaria]|uniref:nucleolar protein dao-5-like n=1 Tax=Mercenaria mercenaria TaxID=6596 RepID=UPI00234F75AB|nr:nucleolar protein dao-5-like [Mercenaria mercenaria]
MLPGEIRRYKQSSFPLLSIFDDTGQLEQRNPKSRFPRLPENGGLKETRLPHIVDKQSLVASSQEERNLITKTKLGLTAHDSEEHRERAPGRLHPNKGKRSRGNVDSDLEQRIGFVGGQNSKPLSKQKLRKRRKRVQNGDDLLDLLDDEELSGLEKILDSDSSDNKRPCARRRHKSHVREGPYSSSIVKDNRRQRIKSSDRSSTKPVKTKTFSEVKEDFKNPKPISKWRADDASLKEEGKQRHVLATEEDRAPKPKAAKTLEKHHGSNSRKTLLLLSLRRFPTGLKKGDKKKVSQFTKLINDKVRKKSTEILLERISDNKNKRTTVKDEVNERISSVPTKTREVNTTKPLNEKPCKVQNKGNGHVKISTMTNKKKENIKKTNNSCKTSSENDIKKVEKKTLKEKAENIKEIPKVCRKKKIQVKGNEIDCKLADNVAQTKSIKSKYKENVTENGSDIYSAKTVSTWTKSKRNKISKTHSDTLGNNSSKIQARERPPDAPKYDTSKLIRPKATKHATPETRRPGQAKPDTSLSKRKALPKPDNLLPNRKTLEKSASDRLTKAPDEKAPDSKLNVFEKLATDVPGRKVATKPVVTVSERESFGETSTPQKGKNASEKPVVPFSGRKALRKPSIPEPGRTTLAKLPTHVPRGPSLTKHAVPVSVHQAEQP